MLELLASLLILILAVALVRRLLGIERGRWGLTLLAVVELIARPGARWRIRGIPRPIQGTRRLFERAVRYVKVSTIAIRQGLLHPGGHEVEVRGSRLGRSLSGTFEEAGGLFVKLGQAMAAQPHLVTRAVAAELARLQDRAAPADPTAARAVIEEELGPPEDVFAELSPDPIGSASIAQTYVARLRSGREVVVKVPATRSPGVHRTGPRHPGPAHQSPRPPDHMGTIAWAQGAGRGVRRANPRGT